MSLASVDLVNIGIGDPLPIWAARDAAELAERSYSIPSPFEGFGGASSEEDHNVRLLLVAMGFSYSTDKWFGPSSNIRPAIGDFVAQLLPDVWAAVPGEDTRPTPYRRDTPMKRTLRQHGNKSRLLGTRAIDFLMQMDHPGVLDADCLGCGQRFDPSSPHHNGFNNPPYYLPTHSRRLGTRLLCGSCQSRIDGQASVLKNRRSQSIEAVAEYAGLTGQPPPRAWSVTPLLSHVRGTDRWEPLVDALAPVIRARFDMPAPDALGSRGLEGIDEWLQLLWEAGLVTELRSGQRGHAARAADGHWVRSSLELAVCSALHRAGIDHEMEPTWPPHPNLNASGRRRADFRVGDVFIEVLGLAGDQAYDAKTVQKVELAQRLGTRAIFLLPGEIQAFASAIALEGKPALDAFLLE